MNKLLIAIVIALAAGGIFAHFHFDPLGSYVYAGPKPDQDLPPP